MRAGREIQAHVGGMAQDRLHLGEPGKDGRELRPLSGSDTGSSPWH